ncbi:sugar transferase [Butyrivibrio sp. INlla21]|uniref:sugar transferase n=1 Tax=Butyrivibrio sp. INlla21 TaxID=1520811 RepID=UPI0008E77ACE|nr:sugar transferase [Butyrivibrio sp. INlla21]SFU65892.1 exopolysaccharide biosynthesis polyprenyl glycosylphosphotransferase [Butyrivibrio sp. INlla21]
MKKNKIQKRYIYRGMCTAILCAIATVLFFVAWYGFVHKNNNTGYLLGLGNLGMAIGIYLVLYYFIGRSLRAFRIGVDRKANLLASQVMTIFMLDFFEIFISCAITGQFRFFHIFFVRYLILALIQSAVLCGLTLPLVDIYRKLFKPQRILEVYSEDSNEKTEFMNERPDKYKVVESISIYEGVDKILAVVPDYEAILLNDIPSELKNIILKECFRIGKRVYFTPKISDIIGKNSENIDLFDTPLYLCRNNGIALSQRILKRFFDLLFSVLAFIVFSPLFLIVAIAIKLEDGGPIFYKQDRVTRGGKVFGILKFRSMIVDAEKDGRPHPAGEADDRITKVGHVIRPTRIDELPQLLNIIAGDMSIVGPRPERVEHVEKYTQDIPEFAFRLKVKGGLTGVAQVFGKYNTSPLSKLKMDLYYITNYSLLLDLQIIFETVKILVQKESTAGFSEEKQKEMGQAQK